MKNDGADWCHSERSEAESRNPVAMFLGTSTESFDFAQDDEKFSSFGFRHSPSSFYLADRRESNDRLADPCQLGR